MAVEAFFSAPVMRIITVREGGGENRHQQSIIPLPEVTSVSFSPAILSNETRKGKPMLDNQERPLPPAEEVTRHEVPAAVPQAPEVPGSEPGPAQPEAVSPSAGAAEMPADPLHCTVEPAASVPLEGDAARETWLSTTATKSATTAAPARLLRPPLWHLSHRHGHDRARVPPPLCPKNLLRHASDRPGRKPVSAAPAGHRPVTDAENDHYALAHLGSALVLSRRRAGHEWRRSCWAAPTAR